MIVVCVRGFPPYLKEGSLYSVKNRWEEGDYLPNNKFAGERCVSLDGIPDEVPESKGHFAWNATRFKVVSTDPKNLSITSI